MKKFGIAIIALAICVGGMVTTAKAEIKVSGDVYAGMYNKYIFRGLDSSGNQWVTQFGADLTWKNLTLSYWSNLMMHQAPGSEPASATKAGEITETDVTLNYTYSPIDLLTFNVGNTFYSFNAPPATDELYAKMTVNTLLSPTFAMYWDCKESNGAGLFYTLSVGHTFQPLKNLGVNLGALISYNQENYSAQFGNNNYSNWDDYELNASADYSVTDYLKISPSYTYSNAISSKARDAGVSDESLYGIKATLSF